MYLALKRRSSGSSSEGPKGGGLKGKGIYDCGPPLQWVPDLLDWQTRIDAGKSHEEPLFRLVDAVEVMNSKVTEMENSFAAKVAEASIYLKRAERMPTRLPQWGFSPPVSPGP